MIVNSTAAPWRIGNRSRCTASGNAVMECDRTTARRVIAKDGRPDGAQP